MKNVLLLHHRLLIGIFAGPKCEDHVEIQLGVALGKVGKCEDAYHRRKILVRVGSSNNVSPVAITDGAVYHKHNASMFLPRWQL